MRTAALLLLMLAGCTGPVPGIAIQAMNAVDPCYPHSSHQTDVAPLVCVCDCGWLAVDAGCAPWWPDGGTEPTPECLDLQEPSRG